MSLGSLRGAHASSLDIEGVICDVQLLINIDLYRAQSDRKVERPVLELLIALRLIMEQFPINAFLLHPEMVEEWREKFTAWHEANYKRLPMKSARAKKKLLADAMSELDRLKKVSTPMETHEYFEETELFERLREEIAPDVPPPNRTNEILVQVGIEEFDKEDLDPDEAPYSLFAFSGAKVTKQFFAEQGYESNGHTWAKVIDGLIRLHMPEYVGILEPDSDADSAMVVCDERKPLSQLRKLIKEACLDKSKIAEALEAADPDA